MRISDWSSDVCSSDLGRDAVLKKRDEGLTRRLVQFKLNDPQPLLHHNEPIWRDGHIAGHITSGAYGHHLGAAVGLGYVSCEAGEAAEDVLGSRYEIEVAGERFSATASLRPMSRSEEHTSELKSLMRISYAAFCLRHKRTTL